jgi:hypothetical protein
MVKGQVLKSEEGMWVGLVGVRARHERRMDSIING